MGGGREELQGESAGARGAYGAPAAEGPKGEEGGREGEKKKGAMKVDRSKTFTIC